MNIGNKDIDMIRDSHVIQIFLFRSEEYLGWDCFNKESIAIGRSSEADLTLNDKSIAAFQAIVFLIDETITVDLFESKSNRKTTVQPGQFDSIEIGPYTLKIKLKSVSNQIEQNDQPFQEKTIKTEKTKPTSTQLETKQNTTSERDSKKLITKEESVTNCDRALIIEDRNSLTKNACKKEENNTNEDKETSMGLFDWEGEDKNIEACFSLVDKTLEQSYSETLIGPASLKNSLIEVIKTRYDKVCDVSFLSGNQKYIIENKTRFCLAENKKDEGQFVFFKEHHKGQIQFNKAAQQSLETLFTPDHIFHKQKRIYRYQLPKNSIAVIHDGPFEYRLRLIQSGESPPIRESVKNERPFSAHC